MAIALFTVVVAIATLVALFLGPELLAGWIVGAAGLPLVTGVLGLFLTVVSFGSVIIAAARRDRWVVSPIKMLSSLVVVGLVGLLGLAMFVWALTGPAADSGF